MFKKVFPMVFITLFLILGCSGELEEEYAVVQFQIGDVKKNNGSVKIGDIIKEKDVLTTGKDAFCDIVIGSSIIRIKQNSEVRMTSLLHTGNIENTTVNLEIGKMLCKPKRLLKSESFRVKTPTAVAAVRGTQFTVETDVKETTRIKVFAGKLKIARRIKKLEGNIDKILNIAPAVEEHEKVVITKNEVDRAEKAVDRILTRETAKGKEKALAIAITKAKNDIVVGRKDISKFAVEDFAKENAEIIKIKERPKEVIRQIVKVIRQEEKMPNPDGRIVITRHDVYFIKGGDVIWRGNIINKEIKWKNKIYIASDNYIFCASREGPIIWRKNMLNDGKLLIRDKKLVVYSKGNETELDPDTGQQL